MNRSSLALLTQATLVLACQAFRGHVRPEQTSTEPFEHCPHAKIWRPREDVNDNTRAQALQSVLFRYSSGHSYRAGSIGRTLPRKDSRCLTFLQFLLTLNPLAAFVKAICPAAPRTGDISCLYSLTAPCRDTRTAVKWMQSLPASGEFVDIPLFNPVGARIPFPSPQVPRDMLGQDVSELSPHTTYIFEQPEYRQMLKDVYGQSGQDLLIGHCLQAGKTAGIELGEQITPQTLIRPGTVGVALNVAKAANEHNKSIAHDEKSSSDDPSIVTGIGAFRFEVVEVLSTSPYPVGRVRVLNDDAIQEVASAREAQLERALKIYIEVLRERQFEIWRKRKAACKKANRDIISLRALLKKHKHAKQRGLYASRCQQWETFSLSASEVVPLSEEVTVECLVTRSASRRFQLILQALEPILKYFDREAARPGRFGLFPYSFVASMARRRPAFEVTSVVIAFLACLTFAVQTIKFLPSSVIILLEYAEGAALTLFGVDYLWRWYSRSFRPSFFFNPMMLVEFVSFLPALVDVVGGGREPVGELAFLRVFRILRLQRVVRDLGTFQRFVAAFGVSHRNLKSYQLQIARVVSTIFALLFIASGLIYNAEHTVNPQIPDFFTSLYFGLVTMTTVGFGDITPITFLGRLVVCLAILAGGIILPVQLSQLAESLTPKRQKSLAASEGSFLAAVEQRKCKSKTCSQVLHIKDAVFCSRCGALLSSQ